ncbi:hypothetical protein BGX38DRAFT_1205091 [Terfezia claveryi]|nr:hypothetical protein BGX38DRAFT_1205091 [Terfezia claveryi]
MPSCQCKHPRWYSYSLLGFLTISLSCGAPIELGYNFSVLAMPPLSLLLYKYNRTSGSAPPVLCTSKPVVLHPVQG